MASKKSGSTSRARRRARERRAAEERLRRKRARAREAKPKKEATRKQSSKQDHKKAAKPKNAKAKAAKPKATKKPKPKVTKKPKPKATKRPKPKAPRRQKPRAPRRREDKALRELVKELGPKGAARRLKKSERTIDGWRKKGVPKRSAENVVGALERRLAGKRRVTVQRERQVEEWNLRREELLAQKDSPVTEAKNIVGVRLNADGEVLGWAPHGTLMRLYAVLSKSTGERRWFWTPAETLAGYDTIEEFEEFYGLDPNEFEIELWFGDLLTEEERAKGGLVF